MHSCITLSLMVLSMLFLMEPRVSGDSALALYETRSSTGEVTTVTEPYASRNLKRGESNYSPIFEFSSESNSYYYKPAHTYSYRYGGE